MIVVSSQTFLGKFRLPGEFCKVNETIDCTDKIDFRLPNGLCNNLQRPFDGSSHTAFDRLRTAAYDDCKFSDRSCHSLFFLLLLFSVV